MVFLVGAETRREEFRDPRAVLVLALAGLVRDPPGQGAMPFLATIRGFPVETLTASRGLSVETLTLQVVIEWRALMHLGRAGSADGSPTPTPRPRPRRPSSAKWVGS